MGEVEGVVGYWDGEGCEVVEEGEDFADIAVGRQEWLVSGFVLGV